MQNPYDKYSETRASLIESQKNTVKKIAFYYAGRVKGAVEVEDLLQIAYLGLVDASHKYSPSENGSFQAYAGIKVRGAVVDYLRKSSNLSRSAITKRKLFDKVTKDLTASLGRLPNEDEVSSKLAISVEELSDWKAAFNANSFQSLDDIHEAHSDWLVDQELPVEEKIYLEQLRKKLRNSLEGLKANEAMVLQLYYVEELNIYEIAEILDISTGRVSQIKSSAVKFLREDLKSNQYI